MSEYNALFSEKYLKEKLSLETFIVPDLDNRLAALRGWVKEVETRSIYSKKEEQLQSDFLNDVFGKVLGYAYERGLSEYNLEKEEKSQTDGTKPDGVLGYLTSDKTKNDIRVVIELKDAFTNLDHRQNRKNDNRTPVEQAFGYVSKSGGNCKWVIVSNFVEIRVYPSNDSSAYQRFMVKDLTNPEILKTFYALLAKDRLFVPKGESIIDELLKNKIDADAKITKRFYEDYKRCRSNLFDHIKANNPDIDDNLVLTKSQKILDRIIFICFCEDIGLLPYKIFRTIIDEAKNVRFDTSDTKLWERLKNLFRMIDQGYPIENINRFNGGLFKDDAVIDNLVIKDSVLEKVIALEAYDFESDLNVNILGHIFEQSITDLEEIKAALRGEQIDKKQGKRKKDGIFYTPEYITKYIVDQAVGGWLEDKKKELGYYDLPKFTAEEQIRLKTGNTRKTNAKIKAHLDFWLKYRDALNNITVLDPACGSGSFLVQVFNYLKEQSRMVNEEIGALEGRQATLFNYDNHILSHNIYGVDLNAESVEITKLALWLKTANKKDPLTSLDNNIKCGNSLVDDPEIDPEHAFDWNKEFPDIMSKGGFDVVVGNPPYVDSESMTKYQSKERDWLATHYATTKGNWDLYIPFYEQGLRLLNKNAYLIMITPNKWLSMDYGMALRQFTAPYLYLLTDVSSFQIFDGVGISPVIVGFRKQKNQQLNVTKYTTGMARVFANIYDLSEGILQNWGEYLIESYNIIVKMKKHLPLSTYVSLENPFTTGETYELIDILEDSTTHNVNSSTYFKFINTGTIDSHLPLWGYQPTRYIKKDYTFPVVKKANLSTKMPKRYNQQNTNKILVSGIRHFESFYDKAAEYLSGKSTVMIKQFDKLIPEYIVCVLNTPLIKWFMKQMYDTSGMGGGINFTPSNVGSVPIPAITLRQQRAFVELSDLMMIKNKELLDLSGKFYTLLQGDFKNININAALANWFELDWTSFTEALKKQKITLSGTLKDDWYDRFERLSQQARAIKSIIDATDKQIDALVYKLYNLTDDEIKIIEKA